MKISCEWCKKEFECCPSRFRKDAHHCCSIDCSKKLLKKIREGSEGYLNCSCPICGKQFHLSESSKEKIKIPCCSRTCANELKKETMKGEGNHQYGLTGRKNSSWKSDEKISFYGYKLIRCPNHPFSNSDGFVFEHRLVAEKYLLNDENSITINGKKYLSPNYVVHHKDMRRLNNEVSNLEVMLKSEHSRKHVLSNPRKHDNLGRFI